jgi:hypothetical protein
MTPKPEDIAREQIDRMLEQAGCLEVSRSGTLHALGKVPELLRTDEGLRRAGG